MPAHRLSQTAYDRLQAEHDRLADGDADDRDAFSYVTRGYYVHSLERCAERITLREGIDIEAARRRVEQVDRERAEYLNELYGVHAGDTSNFDLLLNTDRFTVNEALALIIDAMQRAGYEMTPEIMHAAQP